MFDLSGKDFQNHSGQKSNIPSPFFRNIVGPTRRSLLWSLPLTTNTCLYITHSVARKSPFHGKDLLLTSLLDPVC